VTTRPRRLLARGWVYAPAACSPLGGGLVKVGGGSTWAAVAVGLAPYAVLGLLLVIFAVGYLAALARYLCAGPGGQEAMERLVMLSVNAVVSILTLNAAAPPGRPGPQG
jgi:hypothetical protein